MISKDKDIKIRDILSLVLDKIKIDEESYNKILEYVTEIVDKVRRLTSNYLEDPDNDIFLGGSFPRKTFVKDNYDIDIFIRFPPGLTRNELRRIVFDAAYKLFGKDNVRERFADHPYAEATVNGITINIVPSYKTEPPNWMSPVDRSYFHTKYLSKKLPRDLVDDVLLFKAFLKGVGCYGAEISIKGFSGYLSELLIIYYGGFKKALDKIAKWKPPVIIDIENHYNTEREILDMFPKSHLIVIDPIDKGRNVASALSLRNFSRIISASRAFIKSPRKEFFYPFSRIVIENYLYSISLNKITKMPILTILLIHGEKIEDIYHGQLEKLAKKISRQIELHDVDVLKTSIYSDYKEKSLILFFLSSKSIPGFYVKKGPPVYFKSEEDYLTKNRGSQYLWIDADGKWSSIKKRNYIDVKELVIEILNNKVIKIPSEIVDDEIHVLYIDEMDREFLENFRSWITSFVKGEDFWRTFY